MTNVAIVGISGVGMAHAIAAVNIGMDIVAIVDKNPAVLAKVAQEKVWKNDWEDVHEQCVAPDNVRFLTSANLLPSDLDFIIVATPPHTHQELVYELLCHDCYPKIMIEKPLSYPDTWVLPESPNLVVSAEWTFHFNVSFTDKIHSIRMSFSPSHTTEWGYTLPPLYEFGPHLFSILRSCGYTELRCFLHANESAYLQTNKNPVNVYYDYKPPYGLFVDDKEWKWELPLFERQLSNGGVPISYVAFPEGL